MPCSDSQARSRTAKASRRAKASLMRLVEPARWTLTARTEIAAPGGRVQPRRTFQPFTVATPMPVRVAISASGSTVRSTSTRTLATTSGT